MPSAAALRLEIEHALERRFPAALTPAPRTIREVAATGIAAVDELMGGGLPVGAISELTGTASSGRTSLALAFVARRTAEARACAWVDVNDALDPESAAANGVRLRQLLWMRCRDEGTAGFATGRTARRASTSVAGRRGTRTYWTRLDQGLRATDLLLQAGGFAAIVLDLGDTAPEQGSRIPLATWFRFRQAAERTRCSLVVLEQIQSFCATAENMQGGSFVSNKLPNPIKIPYRNSESAVRQRTYAQSAAAVVLECETLSAEQAGGTMLRGFKFAVRRGRERFAPVEIGTRKPGSPTTEVGRWGGKPPAATWQANAAWDVGAGVDAGRRAEKWA